MQTNNCCKMCMCLNSALERLSSRYSHMLVFSIIYVHYFFPIHPHLVFINHFFSINNGVPSKCLVFFFIQYYYQDYQQVAFSSSNFSYSFSPFRTRRLIHTTVIILNFTWERVPTDEKDASCIFLQTFGFWWVHETVNHD